MLGARCALAARWAHRLLDGHQPLGELAPPLHRVVEHALGTMRFKVLEQPRGDRQAFEEVRRKRMEAAAAAAKQAKLDEQGKQVSIWAGKTAAKKSARELYLLKAGARMRMRKGLEMLFAAYSSQPPQPAADSEGEAGGNDEALLPFNLTRPALPKLVADDEADREGNETQQHNTVVFSVSFDAPMGMGLNHPDNDESRFAAVVTKVLPDGQAEVLNPEFDYIPPELLDLYVTNNGPYQPSYVYRLLAECYHPEDRALS